MIDELRVTDLAADQGGRSWMWQTCTEFGYYQTSTYEGAIFSKWNDLEFNMHMCNDAFFVDLIPDISNVTAVVDDACYQSNIWFGARNLPRDHVYYTNGDVDPWSELSVKEGLTWS